MQRTRLAIFALFWVAWVVALPFAHHHLLRAPREGSSIYCGGQPCTVQCVACLWETTSVMKISPPPRAFVPAGDAEQAVFALSLSSRLLMAFCPSRAPPSR